MYSICNFPQIQKSTKSANTLPSRHASSRYNGHASIGNGHGLPNSHHTPIYAKQPIYQQQQHQQQPPQQQHPQQSQQRATPHQTKLTKQTSLPPPPLYSTAKIKIEQPKPVHNTNLNHSIAPFATSNNNTPNNTSILVASTQTNNQQQQQQLQQQQPKQIKSQQKASFKQFNSNGVGIGSGQHGSQSSNTGSSSIPLQKSKNDVNFDSTQSINGMSSSTTATNSPAPTANGVGKGKKISASSNARTTFAKPKSEQKIFVGKRLTTIAKAQSIGKTKRSFSQSSYHEPLQRIPSRTNTIGNSLTINNNSGKGKSVKAKIVRDWHAPDSYIYDLTGPGALTVDQLEISQCTQAFWFRDIPNENFLTREQRLEIKRDNLRRQAFQYAQAQNFRSPSLAKKRLMSVIKALTKFKNEREE